VKPAIIYILAPPDKLRLPRPPVIALTPAISRKLR